MIKKILAIITIMFLLMALAIGGYYIRDNWEYSTFVCVASHEIAEIQFSISLVIAFLLGVVTALGLMVNYDNKINGGDK